MAKASIHIKACSIAQSEAHNKREKELDYIRKDLSHLNESHYFDKTPLAKLKKQIAKDVKTKTGRAMQKNAVPIQEAVAVIKEDTSMDDLVKFCRKVQDRWGITPLQIHVHRDEGYMRSAAVRAWRKDPDNNPWKPNLHAHIVWRSVLDNGKSVRLTSADCEEMQTMYAKVMGMERGKRTGRKGLSALEFKLQAKEKELEELIVLNETQGKTISDQQAEIAAKAQEIAKLKSDKARIEKAREKAQEEAMRAEKARETAEKNTAAAEKRADDATTKLAELQSDIAIAEERKAAQSKAMQIMEKDAQDLAKAKRNTIEAIEQQQSGGLFTSSETREKREALKKSALESLKDWESKRQYAEDAKNLSKELSSERNKARSAENLAASQSQTDKDLRSLYPDTAQKLDEMNALELSVKERSALLSGNPISVTKQWFDRERGKRTDELTANLSMDGNHVRMNGKSIKDFFADFWAKVAQAANRAIDAFKQKFGLNTNAIDMNLTRNVWGSYVSGDVNGTPLASKAITEESGKSIESQLSKIPQMQDMAFRLHILGQLYSAEELQAAEKGIRAKQEQTQKRGRGRGI